MGKVHFKIGSKALHLIFSIVAAAVLWFYMFSPWTAGLAGFWLNMSISAVILTLLALSGGGFSAIFALPAPGRGWKPVCLQLCIGAALAFALWGIFWIGDALSRLMFDFARAQVDSVYGMKAGTDGTLIALLLLFLIGPAEEFFWRGYVQKTMAELTGDTRAMVVTTLIYALVHIWSFNFMLVMAALVAGAVWGVIYRLRPSLLPSLIVSHALWDALVFIILPI